MTKRTKAAWAASLLVTALVVGAGTWLVVDRNQSDSPSGAAAGSSAVEQTAGGTESTSDAKPSWLFSETAGGGTYTENGDGTATHTLTDVDADVTGFTDRPDRDTVVFPAAKLAEAWPTLFSESEPNAVLVTRDATGAASSFVLTLWGPSVDGSTMTFTAQIVQGKDHSSQVPGMTQAPSMPPPATFGAVSLFIDDVNPSSGSFKCVNGNGQVITPPGTYPVIYKPVAPFVALCNDAGGTVTPKPPS